MSGWTAVFVTVAAVDGHAWLTGHPTLSSSYRRAAYRHPWLVAAATGYLIAHLWGLLPAAIDPSAPPRRRA